MSNSFPESSVGAIPKVNPTPALTSSFPQRFLALLRKESRQMTRDRSNLAVGLLLPLILILLFGYGLSFDVRKAPIAVVLEDSSSIARDLTAGFAGSDYFSTEWMTAFDAAVERMRRGEINAIVRIPNDFSRQLAAGQARVQLLLNGVDSNTAASLDGYVGGVVSSWAGQVASRASSLSHRGGAAAIVVEQRMWFNEANTSTWYLVPGLLVLVLTLIGAFLTSMLIAREWERGSLESLFVPPAGPTEIVLAKLVPYVIVGAVDIAMCLLAARLLFHVPMRGSLSVIVLSSMLYLSVSLLLGLLISGVTRNQFKASQVALLTSFMPALMLSGFVFDLRNVPPVVQVISQILPATHLMGLIKTLFLAGDNWRLIAKECAILSVYAVVLFVATRRTLRKSLD